MYGMLLESVQHYLQLKYGKDFWDKVCLNAGVTNKVFVTHECYSDGLIPRIAKSCAGEVMHRQTTSDFMEFFGRCFLRFSSHYGYDRVLKVYGREFREFLHGIDNLHEHMRFGFPRLQAPSFFCEQENSTGITLHYRSKRHGYQMYVIGQIKECAQLFFNMEIGVEIIKESGVMMDSDRTKNHVVYRILFDNTRHMSIMDEPTSIPVCGDIPLNVLFNIFPFSFVLNEDLTFQKAGEGLGNYLGYSIVGLGINDVFTLRRPIATLTWVKLIRNDKIMFELISKAKPKEKQIVTNGLNVNNVLMVKENGDGEEAKHSQSVNVKMHRMQTSEIGSLPLESIPEYNLRGTPRQNGKMSQSSREKENSNSTPHNTSKNGIEPMNNNVNSNIQPEGVEVVSSQSSQPVSHHKLVMSKSSSFTPDPRDKNGQERFSDDYHGAEATSGARRAHSLGDQLVKSNPSLDQLQPVGKKQLHLKGQMMYIGSWKKVLFIGSPIIGTLEDLRETGLYLNDLSMYDGSRQMVLAGTQKLSQLELSRDMETLYGKMLRETTGRLDKEIQKSEQLLYSLMPKEIAERMRKGETQMDTCETFDDVTILFGYVEGFDTICETAEPMLVVKLINEIFSVFDRLTERHNVYKFETLGDAIYMLVSGAPVPAKSHAHEMAYMALDMLEEVRSIKTPLDGDCLRLRIGMHSGPVVAGVIGEKTPQYCLFGNTVNMASRMQSTGQAMKIHISKETASRLLDSLFRLEYRGSVSVKGVGTMETFWLIGLRKIKEDEDCIETVNIE